MPKEPRPLHDLHPLRLLPLALCLAMVVFCIIRGGSSVEDILSYAPRNVWLAAGFLLLLYLAKCLSVAFPIIVLQVAAGHLFAPAAVSYTHLPLPPLYREIRTGTERFNKMEQNLSKTPIKWRASAIVLAICLVLMVVTSVIGHNIQTSGGTVRTRCV